MFFRLSAFKEVLFYLVFSLLLLFIRPLAVQAEAVAWGGQWQSLSSTHFDAHFPAQLSVQAQAALRIAEQVHNELQPFFAYQPSQRTQLVLVDDHDYSNGWATPIPFNQIRLYLHAANEVNGLEQLDDWLTGLIRHEYAHILHLDSARAAPLALRRVFGRLPLLFPHQFTPPLLIEGLAVYLESHAEHGYGRLHSSLYAMQMRAEIEQGGDSFNQALAAQRDWPVGKQYVYGGYFWQFVAQQYGAEKIQQYLANYSGELLPYFMQNHHARRVFGKSFQQLWQEFLPWLAAQFPPLSAPVEPRQRSLTHIPDAQQLTAVQAQGAKAGLWQIRVNGQDRVAVQRWGATESNTLAAQPQLLSYTKAVTSMDVSPAGELVVARLIPRKTGATYGDLFVWNAQQGWQALTQGQRFTQVRWQNNQHLIALRQIAGKSELWQLDRQGQQRVLWPGSDLVIGSFAIHPNEPWLVASVKRPQRGWNLEKFAWQSGEWQALTDTRAVEQQPEFMPDGRLLFSADYDGTFNIYRFDSRQPNQIEQLTQVTTGAFQPRWFEGQLIYQHYHSEGYSLIVQEELHPKPLALAQFQGRYQYPAYVQPTPISDPKSYRPWSSLAPKAWMPYLHSDEEALFAGAQITGSDALRRHQYQLTAGYSGEYGLSEGQLHYQYDNRYQLAYVRDHEFIPLTQSEDPLVIASNKLMLARHHVWNALEDQLQLHLGVTHERYALAYLAPQLRFAGQLPQESLVGAALTFNNQQYYRNVAGAGWGSNMLLAYENFGWLPSSDMQNQTLNGYRAQASWQHVFDLPGRATLELQGQGGYSNQQHSPYALGGSRVRDEQVLFSRHEFSLPGYPRYTQVGDRFYQGTVAYQHWFGRIERNLGLWPLGLGDISGRVWFNQGRAWFADDNTHASALNAVGAEVQLDVLAGYRLLVPMTIGVARGLEAEVGETQAYVRLGIVF